MELLNEIEKSGKMTEHVGWKMKGVFLRFMFSSLFGLNLNETVSVMFYFV